ncbi:MAG: BrnT family toxin [Ignavibacteriaceae bacterium]
MEVSNLPDPIKFDWDKGNINKNKIKHNIDLLEAEQVFFNQPFWFVVDEKHSDKEKRYRALGRTDNNKELFISFIIRNYLIRIISVRVMNKKERLFYEKVKRNT